MSFGENWNNYFGYLRRRKGRLWEHDVCPIARRAMVSFFHFKQSMLIWLGGITQIRKVILFTPLSVLFGKIK